MESQDIYVGFRGSFAAPPLAPPERILTLKRRHRLHGVRAANRLHASLGKAEVLDLALANQLLDGSGHVFDRNVGIDTVLIEEIESGQS